jgi:hypothetical protein
LNVVGHVNDYEIYSDIKKYVAKEYDQIRILRPTHSIIYINCDKFRSDLNTLCPLKAGNAYLGYWDSVNLNNDISFLKN